MSLSNKWHKRYLELANHVSLWSKDRSTKVGCVIVSNDNRILSLGYNGFPRGINDDLEERHERPLKYKFAEHAERNAIYNSDSSLKGSSCYVTMFPCADCSRAIIQTGIKEVVVEMPDWEHERWGDDFKITKDMLSEAGVKLTYVKLDNEERKS